MKSEGAPVQGGCGTGGVVVECAQRDLLLARRQAILIELGAIEEYLGLGRSRPPKKQLNRAAGKPAARR